MIDSLMGRKRVLIDETERAVWLYKGEVRGILGAGEHVLKNRDGSLRIERQALARMMFVSAYEQAVLDKLPADVATHLTVVRTAENEIAVIERDGIINTILGPDAKLIMWSDAGPWKARIVDIVDQLRVEPKLLQRLQKTDRMQFVSVIEVGEGKTALVSIDGRLTDRLEPGVYGYWNPGRKISAKLVDLTRQALDVTGQEVLTRDRVTLRINISADYRVADPLLAVTSVKDFADALYRALQLAFRKTIGALTLDQILEKKGLVDAEAADKVRADMAMIGVEVSDISLKDVILPGEMREILNQVVAVQKEAEANVIRRREETNATRSLLNTAKVMAENPVMLRLKELEALESIAGKVERLTVTNGTEGLLNDLVRLRD
ncbi:regulator of protease activity HflC (stomatin/prohibitin superfamily) [Sphingopyxis panaciterrae]|uniref:slipin family protein n=1 Tax=Sphingopyxis panaciterrae TaxID=363841 RepID=UPI001ABAD240|nr:slipin family protein [Sphingopyxis panaciterrae]NIJ37971.1 regulator of protease activity HflC (stomatin/prohibitin superfamily) [Sphingopyxis panaciterrae]